MNRGGEAIPLMQKAFVLDPLHTPLYDMYLGRAFLLTRQFTEAAKHLQECVRRAPDFWPGHLFLAATLGHLNQPSAAAVALVEVQRYSEVRSVVGFFATGDFLPGS